MIEHLIFLMISGIIVTGIYFYENEKKEEDDDDLTSFVSFTSPLNCSTPTNSLSEYELIYY